jgi:hypothetical protein
LPSEHGGRHAPESGRPRPPNRFHRLQGATTKTTRRRWHFSALAAVALFFAGCGGGTNDAPLATSVIVFGDSLSDIGT